MELPLVSETVVNGPELSPVPGTITGAVARVGLRSTEDVDGCSDGCAGSDSTLDEVENIAPSRGVSGYLEEKGGR